MAADHLVRLRHFAFDHRWSIAIFIAALVVRLHWNLVVHPLGEYIYSDMNGYDSRAARLVSDPLEPYEYYAFFPFGTHLLVALFKAAFGNDNFTPIGIMYAFGGALCVLAAHRVALSLSSTRWVPHAVGLLGIFYYPHVAIGGYLLSELPFSALFPFRHQQANMLCPGSFARCALRGGAETGQWVDGRAAGWLVGACRISQRTAHAVDRHRAL